MTTGITDVGWLDAKVCELSDKLAAAEQRAVEAERRAEDLEDINKGAFHTLSAEVDFRCDLQKRVDAAEADRDRLRARAIDVLGAYTANSGYEPSLSVFHRAIDALEEAVSGSASPAPSAAAVVRAGEAAVCLHKAIAKAGASIDQVAEIDLAQAALDKACAAIIEQEHTAAPGSALPTEETHNGTAD